MRTFCNNSYLPYHLTHLQLTLYLNVLNILSVYTDHLIFLSEDQLIIATRCFDCRTYNLRKTMWLR